MNESLDKSPLFWATIIANIPILASQLTKKLVSLNNVTGFLESIQRQTPPPST